MTSIDVGEPAVVKGYRLAGRDGDGEERSCTPVHAGALLDGPVSLARFEEPGLAVRLAVALRDGLPAGASPGARELAAGPWFLALEVTSRARPGGVFAVDEWPLAPTPGGEAVLALQGRPAAVYPLGDRGALVSRLAWVAAEVGGLPAGSLVVLDAGGPAEPLAAAVGCVQVLGPQGSVLTVELTP